MPTFDTPEPIIAVVDTVAGHLWINASDRADTTVDVRPTNADEDGDVQAAQQTQVEYTGGRLSVTTPKSRIRSLIGRPPAIDITIELPTGSRVEVKATAEIRSTGRIGEATFDSAAGAIRLDQTGRLRLHTGAGDVSVARLAGPADVSTSSGKIWLGAIDGKAVVKSSNGDITLGEVTGDVRMNTANGDITVDRALATVTAKTANGNVRIGEVARGTVVLETAFGEMEIGIAEGTAAWLDARSKNGSVRSHLDPTDEVKPSEETVEVRARTGFGDIVIRRS